MAFFVVLLFLVIPTLLIANTVLRRLQWGRLPPGPPAWPVIGSLHHLSGGVPHRSLTKLSQKYGTFFFMMLGSMPTVVVSSPEMAKQILQTHDKNFSSRPYYESANRLNYGQDAGVAMASYGAEWRDLRRMYTLQLFTAKTVSQYKPMMREEIRNLIEEVRGYAERGAAYDVTTGIGGLVESILCRILLGKKLEEIQGVGGYDLKKVTAEGTELFITPIIGDLIPWLSFLDGRAKKRMDAWHASFDALLESVLVRRERGGGGPASVDDFLQLLLSTNLPRDRIKGIILELLSAGIDTSATTLDWVMAELVLHPSVLERVTEEVDRVSGNSPAGPGMIQDEDLPQLVYTKAVVKETLRLHPPAPLLVPHMAAESCKVGGYDIPRGTRVFVNAWAIGRDPRIWDRPDDFDPERFIGGQCKHMDVRGQSFELLPFSSGRRSCPGMSLALPILEMTIANLVYSFHWSLPPPPLHTVDMSEKFGVVASRSSPLFAIPTKRH